MVNFPHEGISYNTRIIKNVIQNGMQIILNNQNVEVKMKLRRFNMQHISFCIFEIL